MTSYQSVSSPYSDLSTNKSLGLTIGYMDELCQNYNRQQLLSLNTKLAVVKSLIWHLLLTIHFERTIILTATGNFLPNQFLAK